MTYHGHIFLFHFISNFQYYVFVVVVVFNYCCFLNGLNFLWLIILHIVIKTIGCQMTTITSIYISICLCVCLSIYAFIQKLFSKSIHMTLTNLGKKIEIMRIEPCPYSLHLCTLKFDLYFYISMLCVHHAVILFSLFFFHFFLFVVHSLYIFL